MAASSEYAMRGDGASGWVCAVAVLHYNFRLNQHQVSHYGWEEEMVRMRAQAVDLLGACGLGAYDVGCLPQGAHVCRNSMLLIREAGLEHRLLEYAEIALLAEVGHMLVHVVQISRGPEIAVPLIVGQIDFGEDLSMTPAMLALLKEQVMRAAQELERHAESFPDAVQYVYIYICIGICVHARMHVCVCVCMCL